MAFGSTIETDLAKTGAGELQTGSSYKIESSSLFESRLKIGRFAKMDSGSLDNMDGSANPIIAGVVLRNPSNTYKDGSVITTDEHEVAEFVLGGVVNVIAKAGESPYWGAPVFASNAGDSNDGMATVTSTDIPANARYLETIDTNLWRVEVSYNQYSPDATVQSGTKAIGNSVGSIAVDFTDEGASDMPSSSYSVVVSVENTTDGSPSQYAMTVTAKSATGFTVTLSGNTDSANYKLNWIVSAN